MSLHSSIVLGCSVTLPKCIAQVLWPSFASGYTISIKVAHVSKNGHNTLEPLPNVAPLIVTKHLLKTGSAARPGRWAG
jgi:hypothetical protein